AAIPFGKPHTPTASASGLTTQVRLGWNASGSANGRTIQVVRISIDGGAWENVGLSGTRDVGNDYEQSHRIKVQAMDTEQVWSDVSAEQSARSSLRPQPRWWASQGSDSGNCSSDTCYHLVLNVENVTPGVYQVRCLDGGVPFKGSDG